MPAPERAFVEAIEEAIQSRTRTPGIAARPVTLPRRVNLPPMLIDRCHRGWRAVAQDGEAMVLGVTSANRGEGRTMVALGTAIAIATETEEPTLLLECDFAHPSLCQLFGLQGVRGLGAWLVGSSRLRALRVPTTPSLIVVAAGDPPLHPDRVLRALETSGYLTELRTAYRNIVIDLPSVLDNVENAETMRALVDTLLIVARQGRTKARQLENVIDLLGRDAVGGIVLNGTRA